MTGTWLYAVALTALAVSFVADRSRTLAAVRSAAASFAKLLPTIAAMMLLVGLITALVSPSAMARLLGPASGASGVALALGIGSAVMLPSFVAFPLAGSLLKAGAGYPQVAAFLGTVMAVGVATLPLEARTLGWRAAILRNALALVTAIVFTGLAAWWLR